jgi:hypothetical protein
MKRNGAKLTGLDLVIMRLCSRLELPQLSPACNPDVNLQLTKLPLLNAAATTFHDIPSKRVSNRHVLSPRPLSRSTTLSPLGALQFADELLFPHARTAHEYLVHKSEYLHTAYSHVLVRV